MSFEVKTPDLIKARGVLEVALAQLDSGADIKAVNARINISTGFRKVVTDDLRVRLAASRIAEEDAKLVLGVSQGGAKKIGRAQ